MSDRLTWGDDSFALEVAWAPDSPPHLTSLRVVGGVEVEFDGQQPLVDVLTARCGHTPANDRLIQTKVGHELRYVSHEEDESGSHRFLSIRMRAPKAHLEVELLWTKHASSSAVGSRVRILNTSPTDPLVVRSLTSWAAPFGFNPQNSDGPDFDDWALVSGRSDWLAEGRWSERDLRGPDFPRISHELTGHEPRGALSFASTGTWSTGKHLPVAGVVSDRQQLAWLFQIEHNGAWRWEVGENTSDGYLALAGPTDTDHAWTAHLAPGATFESVPVTVAVARDLGDGVKELTGWRRAQRRSHPDNAAMGVVFNDYMNTLNGDPTTEKLLPLIESAAAAGAEVFCVDAGWYDDSGHWWDSVGEWMPSGTRFPRGLTEVIDHIHAHGMVPGLWLEPEVVGVKSPAALTLPDDAFFQRRGQRVVEHDRYHLDLRHPAAREHLDGVVDRLVGDYRIGFFKLDYNIDPGSGTDLGGCDPGTGLLGHNRAHLEWIDSVLDRHPDLILENCASGAMRTDFAILSRMQLQSTSDQQNFLSYPPIAASAPLSMLPEQAASWAYPQPSMSDEEIAFCLATGLLGRYYLSGYLNRMTDDQRATVAEAVAANKELRAEIASSTPFWPLGIPSWDDAWVALGLRTARSRLITIWNRDPDAQDAVLLLPELTGRDVVVETVFPRRLAEWSHSWEPDAGILRLRNATGSVGARTISVR